MSIHWYGVAGIYIALARVVDILRNDQSVSSGTASVRVGPPPGSEGGWNMGIWPLGSWISTVDYRLIAETTASIDQTLRTGSIINQVIYKQQLINGSIMKH